MGKQKMRFVLTRNADLPSNPSIKTPQYLTKNALLYTILVIYLEINLVEKFNLNLEYILTKALYYKTSFNILMDLLQSNNFITKKSRDKLGV